MGLTHTLIVSRDVAADRLKLTAIAPCGRMSVSEVGPADHQARAALRVLFGDPPELQFGTALDARIIPAPRRSGR